MGVRRGPSLLLTVFLGMVVIASAVELMAVLVPHDRWSGWGCGVVLAAVSAGLLHWRIQRVSRRLETAIRALPETGSSNPASFLDEFEDLAYVVQGTAQRLQQEFATAKESRLQLEALLDSMQDAVIAVDAAGRIQWTNQRMQRLLPGFSAGSIVISSPVRVGHALVQTIRDPEVLECVKSVLETRTVCERRSTTLLPGKIFEVNASPMPGGGAVAVLHDITRVEEVERTQRDFVANVSHELRTPLTSITGYVETLLDHERALSPVAREFLSTILKNATRMNRLTEDLLMMARVEQTEQDLHPVAIPADGLVRDAVAAMAGLVQDSEAVLEVGEVTSAPVFADQDAVMQVLSNLIENAVKYGRTREKPHARVVVSARATEDAGLGGLPAIEFRVRDFGQGIGSEHLERIFERFYRVDKARSRESGGTGLGLAIAQHMVQAQGGTIRAESELNGGSEFIFSLPAARSVVE
jgi:two-component system phosphate regulon sensor histidine kinase PhoR